tara:strand:+ start:769 stop:945 length:177 start_codon:yes stop_codon:yes gene_type:complete
VGDISASGLNMVRLIAIIQFFLKSGIAHPVFKRTGLLGGAERPRVLSDGIAVRARSSS